MRNANQQNYDIANIQLVFYNLISSNCNLIIDDKSMKAKFIKYKSRLRIRKTKRKLLHSIKNRNIFSAYDMYNFLMFLNQANGLNLVNNIEESTNFITRFHIPSTNTNIFKTGFMEIEIKEKDKNTRINFLVYIMDNLHDSNIEISWDIDRVDSHVIDYKNVVVDTTGYKFNVTTIDKYYEYDEDTDIHILKNKIYSVLYILISMYIELIFTRMEDIV